MPLTVTYTNNTNFSSELPYTILNIAISYIYIPRIESSSISRGRSIEAVTISKCLQVAQARYPPTSGRTETCSNNRDLVSQLFKIHDFQVVFSYSSCDD